MDISQRIRQARVAANLSARELASRIGVSGAAISKYELGKDFPRPSVLVRLARELGVKTEFFFREISVDLYCPAFRCREMSAADRASLEASVIDAIERYLIIEGLFGRDTEPENPLPTLGPVSSADDTERCAETLREMWDLGLDPIDELAPRLEDHGIKVLMFPKREGFDGYSCIANKVFPVIACSLDIPGDRQRFTMSHELAHLCMEFKNADDEESLSHRFAAAFLAPRDTVRAKVGSKRSNITVEELGLLKNEFGMSMQSLLKRIHDLGVIGTSTFDRVYKRFISEGWVNKEPGEQLPGENPKRLEFLAYRAIAERMMTPSTVSRLLESGPKTPHSPQLLAVSEIIVNEYKTNSDLASIAESGVGDMVEYDSDASDPPR